MYSDGPEQDLKRLILIYIYIRLLGTTYTSSLLALLNKIPSHRLPRVTCYEDVPI